MQETNQSKCKCTAADTILSYGAEAKKNTQITSQLWYKDTAGHTESTTVDGGNTSLVER